ncbi:hypothetical protein [Ammoniphilus sp. CFH 90114]|nr:hypothetical protein [Ammoniphilus sp. CFH 90114]
MNDQLRIMIDEIKQSKQQTCNPKTGEMMELNTVPKKAKRKGTE